MSARKGHRLSGSLWSSQFMQTVPSAFITKTPPAAVLIGKAIGIESGSGVPNKTKVASITQTAGGYRQHQNADLNAASLDAEPSA